MADLQTGSDLRFWKRLRYIAQHLI